MNYGPDAIELLAAEYVIGTLHSAARRRFEKLLTERADVRYATWAWEQRLQSLCAGIEPVQPPRSLWRRIRRDIGRNERSKLTRSRFALASVTATIAATAVFAFWLGSFMPDEAAPGDPEHLAVFEDDQARALWVISLDTDTGALVMQSLGVTALDDDLVHELWALPAGGNPRSLGLLRADAGRLERTLTPELVAAVDQSASLAISIEPAGGSPTGSPTGPVVRQASLVRL